MITSIYSFGYKRRNQPSAHLTIDCRSLRNPHHDKKLRKFTGKDPRVSREVLGKVNYKRNSKNYRRVSRAHELLMIAEIGTYWALNHDYESFSIAYGCIGGKHRSVALAEELARVLNVPERMKILVKHRSLKNIS